MLKPSAAVELRQIEKEEAEAKKKSPEEVQKIVQETLENYYGVKIRDESWKNTFAISEKVCWRQNNWYRLGVIQTNR